MTDLFRGYDLTAVADYVAKRSHDRVREKALREHRLNDDQIPTWESLSPYGKQQAKSLLLPLITDVLDALESDQVKPTKAKSMIEYKHSERYYENRPSQCDKRTATVWCVHINVHPSAVDAMLERASVLEETTGEYIYGDSWKEWGERTDDDTDRHLAIYFHATPERAEAIGNHIATSLTMAAVKAAGGDSGPIPPHAVSASGDWAEQVYTE
jgi:hypothetical protein